MKPKYRAIQRGNDGSVVHFLDKNKVELYYEVFGRKYYNSKGKIWDAWLSELYVLKEIN